MDDVLDILNRLVAMDTTTRESNLPLIDWVEERIGPHATDSFRLPDPTGTKANLVVRFGPDRDGGVILSAHTDCVPVDDQAWTSDPFTLTQRDSRLFARGTCDMKGFIACCVATAPALAAADLSVPVWFAFSYDEEIGGLGAAPMTDDLAARGVAPQAVIVGEPTSMGIINAHKSVRAHTLVFTGRSAHSSQPALGANAVSAAARVATFIEEIAAREVGDRDLAFDPPHTTFNVAMLRGGTAINIVPDRAELTWEYRAVPVDDGAHFADQVVAYAREEVLPALRAIDPTADVVVTNPSVLPALHREIDGTAEKLVRDLTGTTEPARTASFGTDGARFQAHGWSTVVCGPGSIDVAHRPDEYVEIAQLGACRQLLDGLVARLTR